MRKKAILVILLMCLSFLISALNLSNTLAYSAFNSVSTDEGEGDFGVIKLGEEEGESSTNGGGQYYKTNNTGIRFIIEYNIKGEDVYDRREVGGENSEKYYLNFVNVGTSRKQNVKLLLGDNYSDTSSTFRAPKDGDNVSWEESLTLSNEIELYNFATGEVEVRKLNLNDLANGKRITCDIINPNPQNYGIYYVDWVNGSPERLTVTGYGVKLFASILAARAKAENDTKTIVELERIYKRNFEKIYIKAEILYDTDLYNSKKVSLETLNEWLTYNQIRQHAYEEKIGDISLRTLGYAGGFNYGGKIDFIACKLYEDDERFTLDKYGHLNCSCNYIDKAELRIVKREDTSDFWFKVVEGSNLMKQDGYLKIRTDKYIPMYGDSYYTVSDYSWSNMHLPNLCSLEIDGKYISIMEMVNPKIKMYRVTDKGYVTTNLNNNLMGVMVGMNKNGANKKIYEAIAEHLSEDKPTIFEGWDYIEIQDETIGSIKVSEILLTGGEPLILSSGDYQNLELYDEWSYTSKQKDLKYVGVCVENDMVSSIDFNDKTKYPDYALNLGAVDCVYPAFNDKKNEISLIPTENNPKLTVTFIYQLVFKDVGVPFKVIHYDNVNKKTLEPYGTKIEYADISAFIGELYSNTSMDKLYDTQKKYNEIVNDKDSGLNIKVTKLFELVKNDNIWKADDSNTAFIKSINPKNEILAKPGLKYIADIEDHVDRTSPNRIAVREGSHTLTSSEINSLEKLGVSTSKSEFEQYIPDLEGIIDFVNSTTLTSNDEITIVFLYESVNKTVTIRHKDYKSEALLVEEKEIKVKVNTEVDPAPAALSSVKEYKYMGYGIGDDKTNLNSSTTANLGVIKEDITVTFWYKKDPIIDAEVEPEGENNQEVPSPGAPGHDSKVIVLDDVFELNINIENYDWVEPGSTVNMKFPFDVYYDNEFKPALEKIVIEAIDDSKTDSENEYKYKFRLPSWVIEKDYANGVRVWIEKEHNVITEKLISIKVIGRLYDFTVTNLEGDTTWNTSLFKGANQNKEYKAKELPIGQSTTPQSPVYPYGIKLGSTFLYSINTKGLKSDKIQIETEVIYVDKDGNKVENADIYYGIAGEGEKLFSTAYSQNANNFSTVLNKVTRLTEEVRTEITKGLELQKLPGDYIRNDAGANNTAKSGFANVKNAYKNFAPTVTRVFGNFNKMTLPNTLRTPYANYIKNEVPTIGVNSDGTLEYGTSSKYTEKAKTINMYENEIINSVGHWYGEYRLPASLYAKEKNTGKILNDGYFIVLFKIQSLDSEGNRYLSYTKPSDNTQWMKENEELKINGNKVTVNLPKIVGQTSGKEITLDVSDEFYPVAIYQAGLRLNDDLEIGGIH